MRIKQLALIISLTGINTISTVHAKSAFETYGDIGEFAIPVVALGISWLKDDYEGMKQFGYTYLATGALTQTMKYTIDSTRPNGEKHSMPSGHTSSAFAGAGYLHMRYGLEYGVPAYIASAAVGWSRVDAKQHYWRDVIAGATIGIAFSYLFTSEYQTNNSAIYPAIFNDGSTGLAFSYNF
ncbi:phosphatase PAP2 family protein [Plesiomonas sp.]|uniref:phosphatase PAP2 family protein n=1 Tax=Plesiomonas sp. TaxID=2486279 RepID=UPI003F40D4ED